MAINIDTVYQKVLAIANKEQRGYINPQQFNLFANQAQMDIFEDYFFKLNQLEFGQKNSTQYADLKTILLEKIQPFEKTGTMEYFNDGSGVLASFISPSDLYRIGSVRYLSLGSNLCTDSTFSDASGSEMLTNGTFTGNANSWGVGSPTGTGTGVQYNNNLIEFNQLGYGNSGIWQEATNFASGTKIYKEKTYRVQFEVKDWQMGGFKFLLISGDLGEHTRYYFGVDLDAGTVENGTYSFDVKPTIKMWGGQSRNQLENGLYFTRGSDSVDGAAGQPNVILNIDNISLKEVGNEWAVTPANSWEFGNGAYPTGGGQQENQWAYSPTSDLQRAASNGETHGYIQNAMTLVENNTYVISYTIAGSPVNGKLFLANHLAVNIPENVIVDGSTNNLLLYDSTVDQPGDFTKYFIQGATNTDKLSIFREAAWKGQISNVKIKLAATTTNGVEVQPVRGHELTNILNSKLMFPTTTRPIYIKNELGMHVYPTSITEGITCYYIKRPKKAEWNYTEINSVALYNSGSSVDFELHESEENTLVMKILVLAGINIKDQELTQFGIAKETTAK